MKTMRILAAAVVAAGLLAPGPAQAWPWSTDMMNQPSVKPQEPIEGRKTLPAFPPRSVPVTGLPTTLPDRFAAEELPNPVPATPASVAEGRTLYKIYCAACHGMTGQSDTNIAELIGTPFLADAYVQEDLTDGWIWGTITFGGAIMPAYGKINDSNGHRGSNDLSPTERWHVVNYVKHGLTADAEAANAQAEADAVAAGEGAQQ